MALHNRIGEPSPPAVPWHNFNIDGGGVIEIDCVDIWAAAGLPGGTFVTGAVHIGLDTQGGVAAP